MTNNFKIIIIAVLLLCPSASLAQPKAGTSDQSRDSQGIDESSTDRKNFDQRLSQIKKEAQNISKTMDRSTQNSIRSLSQAMKNRSIDIDIPLQDLFFSTITRWEEEGVKPFSSFPVLINPPLGRDFGLTAEIQPGVIDNIKAGFLQNAIQSNVSISSVYADEPKLKQYIGQLAFYGCLIGQGFLNLQEDLGSLGVNLKKKDDTIQADLAYDDFILLAEGALKRAREKGFQPYIKKLYDDILRDKSSCVFSGGEDRIKCGRSVIQVSASPALSAQGRQIYGEAFAGFKGSFRVSSGLSWQKAVEGLQSTTKASRFAKEIGKSRESLIAQGKTKEAVMVSKTAWDSINEATAGVSTGSTPE